MRAIAVISVIIFHLGLVHSGYLGVDVFFVISGYLITKIIYRETLIDSFSIINFYLRRIRRIIPLVLFAIIICLVVGVFVMLPDDLENLSQSIVATNFIANNVLLLITTGNYWDTVNDFKPLMHTWSLGVEEQFYFILPILFLLFKRKRITWVLPTLSILALLSLILYLFPVANSASKFYLIQFRFFEIAYGGVLAILLKDKLLKIPFRIVFSICLIILLYYPLAISDSIRLILVVLVTGILLISESTRFEKILLENAAIRFIGLISFSLYIWHQIVLAFCRYFIFPDVKIWSSIWVVLIATLVLSVFTYYIVETPFRDKKKIQTKTMLLIVSIATILTSSVALYLYFEKGIIRDVPELNLAKNQKLSGNVHIAYNERIYGLEKDFGNDKKKKILIIGNSFARDWANVLIESKYKDSIEISYARDINSSKNIEEKLRMADRIYFSELDYETYLGIIKAFGLDTGKVWNVGTKNFGSNNGIFYNRKKGAQYCFQRTKMDDGFTKKNIELKNNWGERYIDLIQVLIDSEGKVPVFTPDCKFISQDCRHLTQPGAIYIASLIGGIYHQL